MLRQLHQLIPGDQFEFTTARVDQRELPQGRLLVVACWGVRTPDGKAIDPWVLVCRGTEGTLHNAVLPASVDVNVEAKQPPNV